jgi:hypothetical protein
MSIYHYNQVNPLINPVMQGDLIVAASGEKYIVKQGMCGTFWLQHVSGADLTRPVDSQVDICTQIGQLREL